MVPQLRPSQVNDWLAGQDAPRRVVLDVREPWEVQTAAVAPDAGFEVVAIPMNAIPARAGELENAAVACLCHHGARSQQVALFLERQGFTQVANIAGGIDAWARERDPAVPRY